MKKYLIIGGAGFIGSHLSEKLLELGNEVIVADNFSTGNKKNINAKITCYAIDADSPKSLEDILKKEKPDLVFHLAGDEIFFVNHKTKDNTKRPYMLYVGGRGYEYKNFNLLLDTFIDKKYFLNFNLTLFGGEKELTEAQKEKISKTDSQGNWLVQEFGDDEKLAGLYANATVFVYPSLYEGFGIPPLEAMASGCPVIVCNSSSLPEVVGDAGLLFNTKDPDDLGRNIDKVINDNGLAINLIEKGRGRARQFSWNKTAEIVYQEYLKLQ